MKTPATPKLPLIARERMSGVDTAWLRMDRPTNLMVITGVMIFEDKLDLKHLKRALEERFLAFPRFLQRPVHETGIYYWETDPHFDLERHVHRVALPRPAGKRELQDLTSDLASTALDPNQPLWQFHLVEDYLAGSALVIRIHHCYADGIALIRVLLTLSEGEEKPRRKDGGGLFGLGLEGWVPWLEPFTDASAKVLQWSSGFWKRYFEVVLHPSKAAEYAQMGAGMVMEAGRLLTMSPEPETRFRGEPGLSKRAAWSEPLSLAEVKAVGKTLGCSINDVLLATAAGALRAYLVAHRDKVDGLTIRVAVPVNLRPPEDADQLGNQFGLVFLELPVGVANPLERVYTVRTRMQALKTSPQPMLVLGLLAFAGMAPMAVQEQLVLTLGAHATAVMTNVPGPQQRLCFAGAEIADQIFWVPQSGNVGMGASILSYAGHVQFGLITDAGLVPDPERIVECYRDEFEKLQQAATGHAAGETPAPKARKPRRKTKTTP
jgi:diacylglycerol O-acyltransferase / wax synthase